MAKPSLIFCGAGKDRPFFLGDNEHVRHHMVLGHAGRGKSAALQEAALRKGISYNELLKELEPTEQQRGAAYMHKQAEEDREAKRLTAVCEAYWQSSSEHDFGRLHDALASTLMKGAKHRPTTGQLKTLFMMLPAKTIGLGIAWGFDDTEVGDDICRFIHENEDAVAAQLGLTPQLSGNSGQLDS